MLAPHTCHLPGCERVVPRRMLLCGAHWLLVPRPLQRAVWLAYRPGQEDGRAVVTPTYLAAARAAIAAVEAITKAETP